MDARRSEERRDFGMLSENKTACANMPQEVKYHAWPTAPHYTDYGLDDTIRGIDQQMREDETQTRKHLQPGKY